MKIKILGNPITAHGSFDDGQILTDEKYQKAFLDHLVEANAAEYVDKEKYETKVVEVEAVKKNPSSLLSQPAKVLKKETSKKRKKKQKS